MGDVHVSEGKDLSVLDSSLGRGRNMYISVGFLVVIAMATSKNFLSPKINETKYRYQNPPKTRTPKNLQRL
jgi:hypothetical protein